MAPTKKAAPAKKKAPVAKKKAPAQKKGAKKASASTKKAAKKKPTATAKKGTKKGAKSTEPEIDPVTGARKLVGGPRTTGYHLKCHWGTNKVMAIAGGGTAAGTDVIVYNDNSNPDQIWEMLQRGFYYYFLNPQSNRSMSCDTSHDATIQNTANVQNQNWHYQAAPYYGEFYLNRESSSLYLTQQGTANNSKFKNEGFQYNGDAHAQRYSLIPA